MLQTLFALFTDLQSMSTSFQIVLTLTHLRRLLVLGCTAAFFLSLPSARAQTPPLRVAVKPVTPFVTLNDGKPVGFSIDYWNILARRLNRETEWVIVESVPQVLQQIESGGADVAIAAISMTAAREEKVDFSHGYFRSGLQVMTRAEQSDILGNVAATLFSLDMLKLMLVMGAITLFFTHLIWMVERMTNPAYPRGYFQGLGTALWWTVLTLATVGDTENTPKHRIGRVVALAWMFVSLILIANFTAVATSTATLRDLRGTVRGVRDLPGKAVATVPETTAARYLAERGLAFKPAPTIDAAYAMLERQEVEAIVYDAPVLQHYANAGGLGKVIVVGDVFQGEDYGIALPQGSPLREPINRAILELQRGGEFETLRAKWFGEHR
jgi:ABC-type amino acid transport substrate-binding protein